MTAVSSETLHASCVAIGAHAVLIEGPSGSGKSDLALRLIDRGGRLVSDDYTVLVRSGRTLLAQAPETIRGRIEVRGIGVVEMAAVDRVPVALIVSLADRVERMPELNSERKIAGVSLPELPLVALEASAPIKVEFALKRVTG